MREGLSFEKESPSRTLPKKTVPGLIYRAQIKLCASEAIKKQPIGLFSFVRIFFTGIVFFSCAVFCYFFSFTLLTNSP
jgi:hypothetical protein